MKKILFTIIGLSIALSSKAQDAAEKKLQAGLIIGTGMNFQKMGTKNLNTNGIGGDFNIGANLNFNINENIAFNTGLEFDISTTNYEASSTNPVFYKFNDTEILRKDDPTWEASNSVFQLTKRKQSAKYISIPTMFLFRTNFIGYFRYFGKFGLRHSILADSKSNDVGYVVTPGDAVQSKNENMKRKNEMLFYKGSIGLCGGAEWNFTGSTCLMAELGYYYGFTPLYYSPKEDKMSLYTSSLVDGNKFFSNAATQSQLMLKVSILF
jgi:hypothetical protein